MRVFGLLLLIAGTSWASTPRDCATRIAEAQDQTGSPVGLWVARYAINHGEIPYLQVGEPYSLLKTYDGGFYAPGPLVVPHFHFNAGGVYENAVQHVQAYQLGLYSQTKGFSEKDAARIREVFESDARNPSPRNLLYQVLNLVNADEAGDRTAYIRVHDASPIAGVEDELHPLERITGWRAPERSNGSTAGLLEIGLAFRNRHPLLQDLNAFEAVLKEIGTYVAVRFVSQDRPCVIRALVDEEGRRLFTAKRYGFAEEAKIESMDQPFWVLKMDGQKFVEQFGAQEKPAGWAKLLRNNPGWELVDPLHTPEQYRSFMADLMYGMQLEFLQYAQMIEQARRDPTIAGIRPMLSFRLSQCLPQWLEAQGNLQALADRLGKPVGLIRVHDLPEFQVFRGFVEGQSRFILRLAF